MEENESISRSNFAFVNATTIHPYIGDPSITGLFNVTIHPDEDWTILTDPVERRRVQNRIAQRGYRNRLKHSKKVPASSSSGSSSPSNTGPTSNTAAPSAKQKKSASSPSKNGNHDRPNKKKLRSRANASPLQVSTHHHFVRCRSSISESTEWVSPNGTPSSTLPSPSHVNGIPTYSESAFLASPTLAFKEMHVSGSISPFGDARKGTGNYVDSMLATSDFRRNSRLGSRQASHLHVRVPSPVPGQPTQRSLCDQQSQELSHETSPDYTLRPDPREFNHSDGGTALHRAAFCGHDSVVEALLEGGADLAARNRHGLSALHLVAFNGHQGLVKLLLDNGADVNARGRTGITPLHLAAQCNEQAVVRMLLRHKGSDPNVRDARGQTPLHVASEQGHAAVVNTLLEHGADIDMQDYAGLTALQMGADIHAKSDKG